MMKILVASLYMGVYMVLVAVFPTLAISQLPIWSAERAAILLLTLGSVYLLVASSSSTVPSDQKLLRNLLLTPLVPGIQMILAGLLVLFDPAYKYPSSNPEIYFLYFSFLNLVALISTSAILILKSTQE
jgi:hypothetical protein